MAHGKNAENYGLCGKEYWSSRLHRHGETLGRYTKKLTAKKERRDSRAEIRDLLREEERTWQE